MQTRNQESYPQISAQSALELQSHHENLQAKKESPPLTPRLGNYVTEQVQGLFDPGAQIYHLAQNPKWIM